MLVRTYCIKSQGMAKASHATQSTNHVNVSLALVVVILARYEWVANAQVSVMVGVEVPGEGGMVSFPLQRPLTLGRFSLHRLPGKSRESYRGVSVSYPSATALRSRFIWGLKSEGFGL